MKKKKTKKRRRVILLIAEIILILLLTLLLFAVVKLSKIQKTKLDMDQVAINEDLSSETMDAMSDYRTVALFGLDNRTNNSLSKGRSDVIMLANINNKTHEVQLVSIYRDTYLDTGSGVFEKCNAAYAKGGPEQALSMLNTNLDLAITDYVTVDFSAIVECVDLLGGVEMTITDDEASLMLGYIQELNRTVSRLNAAIHTLDAENGTGNTASCPSSGGTYTLNGVQATAFARIRYGGGDDYKRTERQRAVLSAMIAKAQKSDLKTLNALINTLFSNIQTSFSNADLLALATNIFNYKLSETNGFPYEKTAHRYDKVGDVVIPCDLSSNVTALHQFLYTDMAYTPSDTVKNNSEMITSKTGYREGDGF